MMEEEAGVVQEVVEMVAVAVEICVVAAEVVELDEPSGLHKSNLNLRPSEIHAPVHGRASSHV